MIRTGNLYDTWLNVLKEIYEKGDEVLDERGSETLELTNIISSFPNPFIKVGNIEVIPELHDYWKREKLDKYVKQFNSPDRGSFSYTYGQRLRYHTIHNQKVNNNIFGVIDQIDQIKKKLIKNRFTRRAVAVTWDPYLDNQYEENPCMIFCDYKIRSDKLQTTAIWRSHDIYGAFYPNMIGLSFQTKEIADKVGVEIGDFTIQSISAHIYKTDIDEVKRCLK